MVFEEDYREGLSAGELVRALKALLAGERTAMRLSCRYLADLADCMVAGDDWQHGRDGAMLALAGFADIYHAAECLFGLGGHSTRERIRVGRALRSLPRIEGALVSGELSYSRAREVTRVATAEDESGWLDLARTLPMRALERRVVEAAGTGREAAARAGDRAQMRWSTPETVEVTLRLPAEAWGLLQRAMEGARRASEAALSDAEALAAAARDAIEQQSVGADAADVRRTVVLYECQSCQRAEVDTGGGPLEIGAGAAAALGCGAAVRDLRSEGRVVRRGGPLPRAIERAVRLRDRSTCRVPGCHRRRYVDVHHIVPRSEGGEHSRRNCVCLCTTHHARLHEGHLRIEGDAEGELRFHDATGAALLAFGASHRGTGAGANTVSHSGTAAGTTASHSGTANGATTASHSGTAAGARVSHSGTAAEGGTATGATTASHSGTAAGAFASRGGRAAAMGAGEEAAALLALMGKRGGWCVDELVEASGLRTGVVQSALVLLELDGRVACDGFGSYAPRT